MPGDFIEPLLLRQEYRLQLLDSASGAFSRK